MSDADTPSREQLQAAFNRLRKPDWGADLDAALTHPVRGKIIIMAARSALRAGGMQPDEIPPKFTPKPRPAARDFPPVLDNKRKAAGEREDD